ncbi:MAG: DNA gyrase inhibitor YacG, partial [Azonexus sp.]|nr:DNA gyrase inhibitor YacG [Azonexus sp.]
PFCSERCKQIDLGCWASDSYRIGGAVSDEEAGSPGLDFPDQPTR